MFSNRYIHYVEIDSTHKCALRELDRLLPARSVISAEYQTDGIGTKGRSWHMARGKGLLLSFVFSADTVYPLHNMTQLLGLAVVAVLITMDFSPKFKWPNDILLSNKKVGGAMTTILGSGVVASCGLNVNLSHEDLEKADYPITSLLLESGKQFSISSIEQKIIVQFESYLDQFLQSGFAPFYDSFVSHLAFIDQTVSLDGTKGIMKGVDPEGRLLLSIDGHILPFSSGTLRPTM